MRMRERERERERERLETRETKGAFILTFHSVANVSSNKSSKKTKKSFFLENKEIREQNLADISSYPISFSFHLYI